MVTFNFTCSFKLVFTDQLTFIFSPKSWHYSDDITIPPLKSLHIGWLHHYIGFAIRNYKVYNALDVSDQKCSYLFEDIPSDIIGKMDFSLERASAVCTV